MNEKKKKAKEKSETPQTMNDFFTAPVKPRPEKGHKEEEEEEEEEQILLTLMATLTISSNDTPVNKTDNPFSTLLQIGIAVP